MSNIINIFSNIIEIQSETIDKINQIKNNFTLFQDYSSFEVMPNKTIIPSGTIDNITDLTYNNDIPACTIHKMTLRSSQEPENCDVIIDWGDGTIDKIKNNNFTSHIEGKSYELEHDYAESMTADIQRFIVKIYGKNYYTFRHSNYQNNNLISRIFDVDLPIVSHIGNFASMAYGATRLLKVHFPSYTAPFSNVYNWSSTFQKCQNLISVTGFDNIKIRRDAILTSFMAACVNLVTTDFIIPAGCEEIGAIFNGCVKLSIDINSLIPQYGFTSSNIYIKNTFKNTNIVGNVPSNKLWNNKNINWILPEYITSVSDKNQSLPFTGCPDEIRLQVPISWGGTASDDIIEKLNITTEDIIILNEKIQELQYKINQ